MRSLPAVRRCTIGLVALIAWSPLLAESEQRSANEIVEVRSYNLKPGTRARFHQLFERDVLPMLRRASRIDQVPRIVVVQRRTILADIDSYTTTSFGSTPPRFEDFAARAGRSQPCPISPLSSS